MARVVLSVKSTFDLFICGKKKSLELLHRKTSLGEQKLSGEVVLGLHGKGENQAKASWTMNLINESLAIF